MSTNLTLAQMLAQLETTISFHRERQAFHAQQEELHREQKAIHTSVLEKAVERFEALQAATTAAGDLLASNRTSAAPPAAKKEVDIDLNKGRALSQMITRILEAKAPDEPFGASGVVKEIQERWGAKLRRPVNLRTVATTLRRWAAAGRLHQVREGRAFYESLYTRTKPGGGR